MFRAQAFLIATLSTLASAAAVSGKSALEFTQHAVDFGPRPSGSDAIHKLQAYILAQLKTCKCQVSEDDFTATTPRGRITMKNIIAKFPGKSGKAIVITGHYDTKYFPGRKFVGASDGGSSAGLLLELARALAGQARTDDLYLVWFDGEEAVGEWSDTDSVYGSRHLAERWRGDGTLHAIKALINVDMIGDKHLDIDQETSGNAALNRLVWRTAADLGYAANFTQLSRSTDDDHMPFVKLGVPAIDLIDFDYDPWHTDDDTMDKLSAQSLEIVGNVVVEAIGRLERQ
jgi:Zn-dependent M28 family amino/carboxypeptidase